MVSSPAWVRDSDYNLFDPLNWPVNVSKGNELLKSCVTVGGAAKDNVEEMVKPVEANIYVGFVTDSTSVEMQLVVQMEVHTLVPPGDLCVELHSVQVLA